jgi:hypothetical protein
MANAGVEYNGVGYDEDEIKFIFDTYHSATLFEMARVAGLDVTIGKRKLPKDDLFDKVRAEFFTQKRVLASLAKLDPRERAVLDRLLLHDGSVPTKSFKREIIRAGLATDAPSPEKTRGTTVSYYRSNVPYARDEYNGSPDHRQSNVFEDVIARLTLHGLVFSQDVSKTVSGPSALGTTFKLQFHPAKTLHIPDIVKRHLPVPTPIPIADAAQPSRIQRADPALLLRDLYLYWNHVRLNNVSLVQSGTVAKRSLKTINSVLLLPDPLLDKAKGENDTGRLLMLRECLEALKLIQKVGGQLLIGAERNAPTGKDVLHIAEFWSWPQTKQLSACVEIWSRLSHAGELSGKAGQYLPQVARARPVMLEVLRALPVGIWLEPDELLEQARAKDVDFLFAEHSRVESHRGGWYYSNTGGHYYGQAPEILKHLDRFEAEFVMACLAGFLHQAGVVELGYPPEGDRLEAFRLTALGQSILKQEAAPVAEASETGRLVIQPNFQLMAMGPVSLDVLARLDLFADRQRADRGAFEYHLSRDSVYRAQQLGMNVSEVIRFLEQTGHADLPQNVRRSLEEWAAHHERIVFRTDVSLLQAADADVLARVMQDAQTGPLLARAVSPAVALVAKNTHRKLIATFVGQGLFPAVSGAQPQSADRSVMVQDDGAVHAIHAVPSLYLRRRISRLAEETGREGEWRLTLTSISRAGGSKDKVLGILAELDKLHRGARLPEELVEQIKAWGNYYGDAAAQTLTLIEFRDQSALDELAQHPDLKKLLVPFPAGNRALAMAPEDQLARVKEILAGLGVRVCDGLRN